MANAVFSLATTEGTFSNPTPSSSVTDPITLDGLVNATGSTVPLASLSGDVVYQNVLINDGYNLQLTDGIYNFSGGQLTLQGGANLNSASKFEMNGAGPVGSIVYVGYDTSGNPIAEDFILNFDDQDFTGMNVSDESEDDAAIIALRNTLLGDSMSLQVSNLARMIVNLPVTSFGQTTNLSLATRNVFIIRNNDNSTQVRMTVNMGRYANNVLTTADIPRRSGPALANSLQWYDLGANVGVRDILYRGDYVDWRPIRGSSRWQPLTGGGFIGDFGIKWLMQDQPNSIVTDTMPLRFGNEQQFFRLDIRPQSVLDTNTGNGQFQLGLSPPSTDIRNNRVVLVNPTGISWSDRLGLWNSMRGRLRVEHQTVVQFHVSDDQESDVSGARVVLHHFYPRYGGSTTDFGAASRTVFDRSVTSTDVTGSTGLTDIGNIDNSDYAASDSSTTVNRPVIVEALELNNTNTSGQVYQSEDGPGTSVSYSAYTNGGPSIINSTTYDVFAFRHRPFRNQPISLVPSSATSATAGENPNPLVDRQEQVQIERDQNVTAATPADIPARASTLNDVYDLVHNYVINNRIDELITVRLNGVMDFGARTVILNNSPTVTEVSHNATSVTVPTADTLMGTERFSEITTSSATTPDRTGTTLTGIRIASANDPTIIISGFNRDESQNMIGSRIDFYDFSDGMRPRDREPIYTIDNTTTINSQTGFAIKSLTIDRSTTDPLIPAETPFSGMGPGAGRTLTSLMMIVSRPGYLPEIHTIDVSSTRVDPIAVAERVEAYPGQAIISGFTAVPNYDTSTGILTVTIGGGGGSTSLTSTQTNRLLMDNVYGSSHFNRYLFVTSNVFGMGSRGEASVWFADGAEFKLTTANFYEVGRVENTNSMPTVEANRIAIDDTITDSNGRMGRTGILTRDTTEEFDLQAIVSLTNSQTASINNDLTSFRGDDPSTPTADRSSLRVVRDEVRRTRSTILGNL